MAGQSDIHYEVLGRRGTSWTILMVSEKREAALKQAETLWDKRQYKAVRVIKESYDPTTQQFSSVDIFTRGKIARPSKHDDAPNLSPCLLPDDIYGPDGRRSIWHLMRSTLTDWGITPSELLHNLEHYFKLYNAGTKLQHAIQRTAVAFENEEESVQERMRKIERLVEACVETLKKAQARIPSLEAGRLKPVAKQIEDRGDRMYLLMASISEYLRPAPIVTDRFGRLILLMSHDRPTWVRRAIDQIISEQLQHERLLWRLFEEPEERMDFIGGLMLLLTGYLGGTVPEPIEPEEPAADTETDTGTKAEADSVSQDGSANALDPDAEEMKRLAEAEQVDVASLGLSKRTKFQHDLLTLNTFLGARVFRDSYAVISQRILYEISLPQNLVKGPLPDQLHALNRLRTGADVLLVDDQDLQFQIHSAIDTRAGRLLSPQAVSDTLYDIKDPFDKVGFLLDMEVVCHGVSAKREIANLLMPIFQKPQYEAHFLGLDGSPFECLQMIVELQSRVIQSNFSEMHQRKISEQLDTYAATILDNTDLLKKLDQLGISVQDKANKILTMLADGYFTEGVSRTRAEDYVRRYMRLPHFVEDMLKTAKTADESRQRLVLFRDKLREAGLMREAEMSATGLSPTNKSDPEPATGEEGDSSP